jgi:hypothetical protein
MTKGILKKMTALPMILPIMGLLTLIFTLLYGGVSWGIILFCVAMILVFEYFFSFRAPILSGGGPLLNPYALMVFTPLLLVKYSSITDFTIRLLCFLFLIYIVNIALYTGESKKIFSLMTARPLTIWFIAFLLFSLVATVLFLQGIHISGDEPHYLMISQSLVQDGDFDLKNNVEEKTYFDYLPIELRFHGGVYLGKYLSFHLPGVSFLLLPFYWFYKVTGAIIPPALFFRLAAAFINAFFALCLFLLLKMTFPGKEVSRFWLFMLVIFPLVSHGVHLYPELPGATLMMAAYLFTFGEKKKYLSAGLFLAAVPWFHVKYIPPLGILTLAILYHMLKPFKSFHLDKEKIHNLLRFFVIPFISLVLLVLYCKILYGSYSPTNIFPKESYWSVPWLLRLKVFLAYFLDQRDGLLFYSPLFFLLFFSFKRKWNGKYLLLGIAFSYVFFHAFTTVRGAYAPAGRPLIFVSWIFILFIAHFYFNIIGNNKEQEGTIEYVNGFRIVYRLLAGFSLFMVAWLFYYPLFVYQPVFAGTVERASSMNLFFGGDFIHLWNLFPSFLTNPRSGHLANYIWLALIALLLFIYYWKSFKRNELKIIKSKGFVTAVVFGLFVCLGYIYSFYPHVHLINKNKYMDRSIGFYNNSRNFRYLEDKQGFRIKAGNRYDIFIDRKMTTKEEITLHFTHTDQSAVTLRNGKRLLFKSTGEKESSVKLQLSQLSTLKVTNKEVSHIGFETAAFAPNAFLWLKIIY